MMNKKTLLLEVSTVSNKSTDTILPCKQHRKMNLTEVVSCRALLHCKQVQY